MAADAPVGTTLVAGIEGSNQNSQRFDLGLGIRSKGGTSFDLLGSNVETDTTTLNFSSTAALAQVGHDFGRFGVSAGVRHVRDEDLTNTLGYLASGSLNFDTGRLTANIESRDTDFDDVAFTASGSELGLTNVTSASGVAACSVSSLGYGLNLNIGGP